MVTEKEALTEALGMFTLQQTSLLTKNTKVGQQLEQQFNLG